MTNKLTTRQLLFCEEYLIDNNAKQAAIRAGYSKKTSGEMGYENLNKPHIKEYIQERINIKAKRLDITSDRILQELARIAYANPSDVADWTNDGVSIKDINGLTDDTKAAISEVSQTAGMYGKNIKVKMYDKLSALEKLGKYLKMFTDKTETAFVDKDGEPIEFKVMVLNAPNRDD